MVKEGVYGVWEACGGHLCFGGVEGEGGLGDRGFDDCKGYGELLGGDGEVEVIGVGVEVALWRWAYGVVLEVVDAAEFGVYLVVNGV